MTFDETLPGDLERITRWTELDNFHTVILPKWWLTGNGDLSFCVHDDEGPVFYVRVDREFKLLRMNCQFGPLEEVSKRRVIAGIKTVIDVIQSYAKGTAANGMILSSENPTLIKFLARMGFVPAEQTGDFVLYSS